MENKHTWFLMNDTAWKEDLTFFNSCCKELKKVAWIRPGEIMASI
jgi:hypothetical protein